MRVKDIKIGEFYRVKGNNYAWAQAVEVIPPTAFENDTNATLVKCRWVVDKKDTCGLMKYFKVSELTRSGG